jgi:transcriptional regulator with XRE-family HTH domain
MIGKNIKKYRAKLGLTQEDLARKAEVRYTTLTKIESDVIKNPSVYIVEKIAKALKVSIEKLLK